MGAAARKIAHTAGPTRPQLRLLAGGRTHSRARGSAAASGALRVMMFCLSVLMIAGVARVALAAQAAEASIDAWELKAELKAERAIARTLEADKSSLAAPSRIEAVACQTLNMARPAQVAYLQLPDGVGACAAPEGREDAGPLPAGGAEKLMGTLVDLAASEAQVLLVGDVGLGASR